METIPAAASMREEILRAGVTGELKDLMEAGSRVTGHDMLLGDSILTVLSWTGDESLADLSWDGFVRRGLAPDFRDYPPAGPIKFYELPYSFKAAALPNRKRDTDDLVIDLEMEGGQTAHLVVLGNGTPVTPLDLDLLGTLCLAVVGQLKRWGEGALFHRFSPERFLLQMIQGVELDEPTLRFRAELVGLEAEGIFSLILFDLHGYHPNVHSIATVRGELEQWLGHYSALDGETLVLLLRHKNEEEVAFGPRKIPQVTQILEENRLRGVLSRPFYRLRDIHEHYLKTSDALSLRYCVDTEDALVPSECMEIFSLVKLLDNAEKGLYMDQPILNILAEADHKRKSAYLETLYAYLRDGQKPAQACQRLHIHRNTLDYRLRRIEELTGIDWGDGDLLFRLYFHLCAMRYKRK